MQRRDYLKSLALAGAAFSPVGNEALTAQEVTARRGDLASANFGIQEGSVIHGNQIREVFPGTPVIKNGFLYVNEAPGLDIDI